MIKIRNLHFKYPGRNEETLKGINLKIKKGEFILLTGPTGCGKTTLLKTLNGIIPHESSGYLRGKVTVNDINTRDSSIKELSQIVGLVFQSPDDQIFSTIVEDEIAFGPENLCLSKDEIDKRVDSALRMVGMSGYRYHRTDSLSGGQKQRIAIASMLAMKPLILALDEPLSQLDPKSTREILSVIENLNDMGMTIVMVEHRIHEVVDLVDRIVVMNHGKIIINEKPRDAFKDINLFHELGLRVPEHIELFHRLSLNKIPLSVDEAINFLRKTDLNLKPDPNGIQDYPSRIKNIKNIKNSPPLIRTDNLYFAYEKGRFVLNNINLKIGPGEIIAILGENGSGKSTLLLQFAAVLKPTNGRVNVLGIDTDEVNPYKLAGHVGIVFQNPDLMLFQDTVEKEVEFGPKNLRLDDKEVRKRVNDSLEALTISNLRDEHPQSLSRGQRLRTAVASILSMKPKILLLDEPTSGQDIVNISSLMEHCRTLVSQGTTIIFITHDIEIAIRYADRVIVMNSGQIIADGDKNSILGNPDIYRKTSLNPTPAFLISKEFGANTLTIDEFIDLLQIKND